MELKLGAGVWCSDADQVGTVHFVVLDKRDGSLESIVVERGFFGERDTVVPAEDIQEVSFDGGRVDLKISEAELSNRTEFVPASYIMPNAIGNSNFVANGTIVPDTLVGPFTAGEPIGQGALPLDMNGIPALYPVGTSLVETGASVLQPQIDERVNVDEDRPVIKEGARVADNVDDTVGHISSLQLDQTGHLSGLTIKEGFLFTKQTFIPASWIDAITTDGISLKYSKDQVKNLSSNADNSGGDMLETTSTLPTPLEAGDLAVTQNNLQPAATGVAGMRATMSNVNTESSRRENVTMRDERMDDRPLENSNTTGTDRLAQAAQEGPLTPATNRIAEQISGDTADSYTGANTNDQGDVGRIGGITGVPLAPASVGGSATNTTGVSPLVPPILPNTPLSGATGTNPNTDTNVIDADVPAVPPNNGGSL